MKDEPRTSLAAAFESIGGPMPFYRDLASEAEDERFYDLCNQMEEQEEFRIGFREAGKLYDWISRRLSTPEEDGYDLLQELEGPVRVVIEELAYRQVIAEREGATNH